MILYFLACTTTAPTKVSVQPTSKSYITEGLIGRWTGVEPTADIKTGWFSFDLSQKERPVVLELFPDGQAKGAGRFIAFGRNSDNTVVDFGWREKGQNLFFSGSSGELRMSFFLRKPTELHISSCASKGSDKPISLRNYELLTISGNECSFQLNKRAEPYTAPCSLEAQEGKDYQLLSYQSKSSTGTVSEGTLYFYPAHEMYVCPPKYILQK